MVLHPISVKYQTAIRILVAGLFLQSLTMACTQKKKPPETRPNIVFILSDDHAYQAISAYGYKLNQTPNIDRLAKEGILFTRAFVGNSICAPSRASFLTGKYSHRNGIRGNGNEIFDGSQPTFPKLLQQAGYQTAMIGKWHLVSKPTGFDYWNILPGQGEYYNPDFIDSTGQKRIPGYVTDLTTDDALRWLGNQDPARPFCLLLWNKAPHRDWMPALKYLNEFQDQDFPPPADFFDDYASRTRAVREQKMEIAKWLSPHYDLKEDFSPTGPPQPLDSNWKSVFGRLNPAQQQAFREAYAAENSQFKKAGLKGKKLAIWKYERYLKDYLRCIQSVDDNVGRVLDFLKANGLDKNTIVVYASDQGFYLGEHGWFDKRFMYEESFRTPLLVRWPSVIRAGRVNDDLVMNVDLAETLLDAAGVKIPEDMQGASMLPIWKGKTPEAWRKYVYYHYYESGGEHNVAKHVGIRSDRYKLINYYENGDWEFYDLEKDPRELHNLYNDPAYAPIRDTLKIQLQVQMKKLKDSL